MSQKKIGNIKIDQITDYYISNKYNDDINELKEQQNKIVVTLSRLERSHKKQIWLKGVRRYRK